MTRKYRTYYFILFTLLHTVAFTQHCGFTPLNNGELSIDYSAIRSAINPRSIVCIPITFHFVTHENEAVQIDIEFLNKSIEKVNDAFRGAAIEFYLCGKPMVSRERTVKIYNYTNAYNLYRKTRQRGTINVYIVRNLFDAIAGFSTLPNYRSNYVFVTHSFFSKDSIGDLLTHELGHYFGLYHTFETFFGKELADGSNCAIAGDLICDTPAEPDQSRYRIDQDCNYSDTKKDSVGNLYQPDTRNFMSYVAFRCIDSFTTQQLRVMRYYAENFYQFDHTCKASKVRLDYSYISPNPIQNEELRLLLRNDITQTAVEVNIVDIKGSKIKSFKSYKGKYDYHISFPVHDLTSGLYFVSVRYIEKKGEVDTFKFVKN